MKVATTISGIILSLLLPALAWAEPHGGKGALQIKAIESTLAPEVVESYWSNGELHAASYVEDYVAVVNSDPNHFGVQTEDLTAVVDTTKAPKCALGNVVFYRSGLIALVPRDCLKEREALLAEIARGTSLWLHNVYLTEAGDGTLYAGLYLQSVFVQANDEASFAKLKDELDARDIPYRSMRTPNSVTVELTGDSVYRNGFELARAIRDFAEVRTARPNLLDLQGPIPSPSMGTSN